MGNTQLAGLRQQLERLERGGKSVSSVLPFGIPAIDAALPGGGLACGVLHEVGGDGAAAEEGAEAAAFLAGIVGRLEPSLPVLWCLARADLHAPGLALHGLTPERLILMRGGGDREILWAMEEGLRCRGLAAVVGEVEEMSSSASRRLQLAAESSGVTAFVLRRPRRALAPGVKEGRPIAAVTRWRITTLPGRRDSKEPGLGRPLWQVELWRCRGGMPAAWIMEACDATGHVSLATELADRPAEPSRRLAWG